MLVFISSQMSIAMTTEWGHCLQLLSANTRRTKVVELNSGTHRYSPTQGCVSPFFLSSVVLQMRGFFPLSPRIMTD